MFFGMYSNIYTFIAQNRGRHRSSVLTLFVLTVALLLITVSCDQSFSMIDSLDGSLEIAPAEEPAPLTLSPTTIGVYIGSFATFTAAGGEPPYTFSIESGSGSINSSGLFSAPLTPGETTVQVTDSAGSNTSATVYTTDMVSDIDYVIDAISNTPPYSTVGSPLNQTFTVRNQGSESGGHYIYWTAFVSDDQTFGGDDQLLSSGFIGALDAAASSSPVTISGTWPGIPGLYYLIVNISAGDEQTPANNSSVSAVFTISSSGSDIDYIVKNITNDFPTIGTGDLLSESFDLSNIGGVGGASSIDWEIYASSDSSLDTGSDTLLGSGSSAPLASGGTVSIPMSGAWPALSGDYYLFVSVSSADETITGNNSTNGGLFSVIDPPDYQIVSTVFQATGTPGALLADTGAYSFAISEIAGIEGNQPVSWKIYFSYDMAFDVSDSLVKSGYINPLEAGGVSATISYDDISWPSMGAYHYVIINIHAGDDSNTTNDTVVSPVVSVEETYGEGVEINSSIGPSGATLTSVSDLGPTLYGNTLKANQLIRLNGNMDAGGEFDTYKFVTGPNVSSLTIAGTWNTGNDSLDFFLWDESSGEWTAAEAKRNKEPSSSFAANPGSVYYLGVSFKAGTVLDDPYEILIEGN